MLIKLLSLRVTIPWHWL